MTPGNPGNSGGKKGRSGRKPKPFKILCRELVDDPEVQATVREAMVTLGPQFAPTLKLIAGYAEGEPIPRDQHERLERIKQLLALGEERANAST